MMSLTLIDGITLAGRTLLALLGFVAVLACVALVVALALVSGAFTRPLSRGPTNAAGRIEMNKMRQFLWTHERGLGWTFMLIAFAGAALNIVKSPLCFWIWMAPNAGFALLAWSRRVGLVLW